MPVRYPSMSKARLRMLREPGFLYAAHSRYCDWIKVGFTSKSAAERLDACNKQYAEFAPFSVIGSVRSTWDAEQQVHWMLSPFRQRRTGRTKELYPQSPLLLKAVRTILANPEWDRLPFDEAREIIAWARRMAAHPAIQQPALESYELLAWQRRAA